MASRVTVQLARDQAAADTLFTAVRDVFVEVETTCSRFLADSDLVRANAAGTDWCTVHPSCVAVVQDAYRHYLMTDGTFDPRVLRALHAIGYDRSFAFDAKPDRVQVVEDAQQGGTETFSRLWLPEFDRVAGRVRIGPDAIDLGGIGKGWAVRAAADRLGQTDGYFLIEAGGDCYLGGLGPTGAGWNVGVENPRGGTEPIAVLQLSDTACATTSIRHRSWRVGERAVHHLIDPTTGRPSDSGLLAVTVVWPDAVTAEVLSKVLFLAGPGHIAAAADRFGCPALWVSDSGELTATADLADRLLWTAA